MSATHLFEGDFTKFVDKSAEYSIPECVDMCLGMTEYSSVAFMTAGHPNVYLSAEYLHQYGQVHLFRQCRYNTDVTRGFGRDDALFLGEVR